MAPEGASVSQDGQSLRENVTQYGFTPVSASGFALAEVHDTNVGTNPARCESAESRDPVVMIGGQFIRLQEEQVDIAAGLHFSPGGRAEDRCVGRRDWPGREHLAQSPNEVLTKVGELDDRSRCEVVTIEAV